MDILFELNKAPQTAAFPWMPYLTILIKRSLDSGFLEVRRGQSGNLIIAGVDSTPVFVSITQKGREFVADLGDHEL